MWAMRSWCCSGAEEVADIVLVLMCVRVLSVGVEWGTCMRRHTMIKSHETLWPPKAMSCIAVLLVNSVILWSTLASLVYFLWWFCLRTVSPVDRILGISLGQYAPECCGDGTPNLREEKVSQEQHAPSCLVSIQHIFFSTFLQGFRRSSVQKTQNTAPWKGARPRCLHKSSFRCRLAVASPRNDAEESPKAYPLQDPPIMTKFWGSIAIDPECKPAESLGKTCPTTRVVESTGFVE